MLCISLRPNSKLEKSLIDKCISKCLICTGFIFCAFHMKPNSKLEQSLIDKCISKCLICTGFICISVGRTAN